jgi:hypothetical protein
MAILDNTVKNAVNTNVGFKISKPGYDANKTAGSNLVFSSSWPSLQTAFEATIDNPITGPGGALTIAHNLKFPPFTMVWAGGPDPSGLTAAMAVRRIMGCVDVDGTNLYLNDNNLSGGDAGFLYSATKLHIKSFQVDLSKDIDYILAAGDTFKGAYDANFGVKMVKKGKDINSRDLRDFAIHSRAQSPLVLAIKTQATNNAANSGTTQYTSKYKYPIWVYGYVCSAGRYRFSPLGGQAYPVTFTDGFSTNLTYEPTAGDDGATLVVLRDPMFAANSITATY